MPVRALSISGPFAYWMASQTEVPAYGTKSLELRSWRSKQPRTLVLLHISGTKDYDHHFAEMPWTIKECPKYSIVGSAVFQDCVEFGPQDEARFEALRRNHCWVGEEDFDEVYHDIYGKTFFGHRFTDFCLFDQPVLKVPGDRGYWQPNAKKPQYEDQLAGFKSAIALTQQIIKARHDVKSSPSPEVA
jgi:hypothetical protein